VSSILRRSDYEDFLIRVNFGSGSDHLQGCCNRAYRDFNRTLRGIGAGKDIRRTAEEALQRMLASIQVMEAPAQAQFDEWHRRACLELTKIYHEGGYQSFYVGHAQKWLNMTFKYIYVLGEDRLPNFGHLYDLCHVPLDNILIKALRVYGFEALPCAWSHLDDYEIYLDRQRWVRSHFRLAPLDVEFLLWMDRPVSNLSSMA